MKETMKFSSIISVSLYALRVTRQTSSRSKLNSVLGKQDLSIDSKGTPTRWFVAVVHHN